jgi:hypothetical protein
MSIKFMRLKESVRSCDDHERKITVFTKGQVVRVRMGAPNVPFALATSDRGMPDEGYLIPSDLLEPLTPTIPHPTVRMRAFGGTKYGVN